MDIEHERRLTEVEGLAKAIAERLNDMEKRQDNLDELVCTVKVLVDREERMENDVKEIKSDVKSLTGKSGKRWDNMIDKIVITIVAAVIGFIMAQIGF